MWFGFLNASFARKSKAYDIELRIWPLAFNLWRDKDKKKHFKVYKGWVKAHVELPKDEGIEWKEPEGSF